MFDRRSKLRAFAALLAVVALVGCVKKGGEAVVVAKEYKPAVEIVEALAPSDAETTPAAATSPRMIDEQWIVSVRMVSDNRWIDVPVQKPQFEKLKEGDRVKVTYREGKYTGTAWAPEIR